MSKRPKTWFKRSEYGIICLPAAEIEPNNWDKEYGMTFFQSKPRYIAWVIVMAGFRCAPEIEAVTLIASVTAILQTTAICQIPVCAALNNGMINGSSYSKYYVE